MDFCGKWKIDIKNQVVVVFLLLPISSMYNQFPFDGQFLSFLSSEPLVSSFFETILSSEVDTAAALSTTDDENCLWF